MKHDWPNGPKRWLIDRTLYISIPFTWNLKELYGQLSNMDFTYDKVIVGGPATKLMPHYFDNLSHVEIRDSYQGAMQIVNPLATKTTTGCIRSCGFCAVPKMEGKIVELNNWPDKPIICDNNLLGASIEHFDKVINRLKVHGWADFNQGLDSRLLTDYHAKRLREIGRPLIRLALDSMAYSEQWEVAFARLRSAGFPLSLIRSYALIAFSDEHTVNEAWNRCGWIENHKIYALPMWYHELDALDNNIVTEKQKSLGWNESERTNIMGWYYKHRGKKGPLNAQTNHIP